MSFPLSTLLIKGRVNGFFEDVAEVFGAMAFVLRATYAIKMLLWGGSKEGWGKRKNEQLKEKRRNFLHC
jgi:hypothetical protein